MTADFAPRLARVLTEYCRPVHPGDAVLISAPVAAEPLVEALVEAVLRRGGYPMTRVHLPNLTEIAMLHASDEQFDFIDPGLMAQIERADIMYTILADENTKNLAAIDPARVARRQQGQRPFIERYLARCDDDSLRWNISAWPTQGAAQDAEMGLVAYREFCYRACGLDHGDPVAHWTALRDRQSRLVDWLADKRRVEVRGPGIDLTFSIEGRAWVNCHGIRNFPDGEIFTCPVEDSVNGSVAFNLPTVNIGQELHGVRLVFREGVVVEASAEKGEDHLLAQLDLDAGARRLGEFAIGTNDGIDRFTRNILFDEKMGGTLHMALGQAAGGAGGTNQSTIHWDMVHAMRDGGEIRVDGDVLYRDGAFALA